VDEERVLWGLDNIHGYLGGLLLWKNFVRFSPFFFFIFAPNPKQNMLKRKDFGVQITYLVKKR
jgi:hypothetical protein